MQTIQYQFNLPRYAAISTLGSYWPEIRTGRLSLMQLANLEPPPLPAADWVRIRPTLSGICGSDLDMIRAKGGLYMNAYLSAPFTFGHEVVGLITEVGSAVTAWQVGDRVVLDPTLSCAVRGINPVCRECQAGHFGTCENFGTATTIPSGIQTGICRGTGGGWSESLVAHTSQLFRVPTPLTDSEAVLAEPFSCALHAVLQAHLQPEHRVLIIGLGTLGLMIIAALRATGFTGDIAAIAKHPHQATLAKTLGANQIFAPDDRLWENTRDYYQAKLLNTLKGNPVMVGGADCTFDCIASSTTLDEAVRVTRSRGQVVVVGLPDIPKQVDWTAIWHQELRVQGSYTYGSEQFQGRQVRTLELALELIEKANGLFRPFVTHIYDLADYQTAITTALNASTSQAIKVAFRISPP